MKSSSHFRRQAWSAFTVIELMVVVAIIGLLMAIGMSAFAAAVAQSKVSRTKVIIAKLDQLVTERYESFRTRPVPIRTAGNLNIRTASQNRLNALRELMRIEMPGCQQDVSTNPTLVSRTAISRGYQRRVPASWSKTWEQAECLYLIIASMKDGDKSALDFFTRDEVGDTDGDGVPEILDAWGTPIQFIRWAPGYLADDANFPALTMQNQSTPDSFDLLRADARWNPANNSPFKPYDLKPLIFSYGPDRLTSGVILSDLNYASSSPPNDPYMKDTMSGMWPGQIPDSAGAAATADNISNHYQEAE